MLHATKKSRAMFKTLTHNMSHLEAHAKVMKIRNVMTKTHVLVLWHPDTNFVLCSPDDVLTIPRYYDKRKQADILNLMQLNYKQWRKSANVEPQVKYGVIFAEVSSSLVCVVL